MFLGWRQSVSSFFIYVVFTKASLSRVINLRTKTEFQKDIFFPLPSHVGCLSLVGEAHRGHPEDDDGDRGEGGEAAADGGGHARLRRRAGGERQLEGVRQVRRRPVRALLRGEVNEQEEEKEN